MRTRNHSALLLVACLLSTSWGCSKADDVADGKDDAASVAENSHNGEESTSQDDSESASPDSVNPSNTDSESTQPEDPEVAAAPGLAIGQKAPNFELTDQHGNSQTLEGMLSKGPVALVFYRSADW